MTDNFKLTSEAKEAILEGWLGDIREGMPFDRTVVRVEHDPATDTYRVKWSLWQAGVKMSEYTSEPFSRANINIDSELSMTGRVAFTLIE